MYFGYNKEEKHCQNHSDTIMGKKISQRRKKEKPSCMINPKGRKIREMTLESMCVTCSIASLLIVFFT